MRVYIIRHGQSAANVTGARNGQGDVPLTQRGKEEALGLRLKLSGISFDRIYSSDLIRAIDTCKTAIPESDPIRIKDLREIDVGGLAGKTNEECLKLFGPEYSLNLADFNFAPYGGENLEMVFERSYGKMNESDLKKEATDLSRRYGQEQIRQRLKDLQAQVVQAEEDEELQEELLKKITALQKQLL